VKDDLNKSYSVTGIVKVGSDINTLTNSVKGLVQALSKNDVLVFSDGMRDVEANNTTEGLRHIQDFVRKNDHTNIVLLSVPYRCDLISWSCVNNEITAFNQKLTKSMQCHGHVRVVNCDLHCEFCTRYCLHLNNAGKDELSKNIATTCLTILHKKVVSICLSWKDTSTEHSQLDTANVEADVCTTRKVDNNDQQICNETDNTHLDMAKEETEVSSPIPLNWKVRTDYSASASNDLQLLEIDDILQHNEDFCTANELGNSDIVGVACNVDLVQYSSDEHPIRKKIPENRKDYFLSCFK
jgi:hypothetical protein